MGKAKSGNSNVLKVVSIVAAIVVAVGIIAVFVAPLIPVRKVDESAYKKLDNNDVYEPLWRPRQCLRARARCFQQYSFLIYDLSVI